LFLQKNYLKPANNLVEGKRRRAVHLGKELQKPAKGTCPSKQGIHSETPGFKEKRRKGNPGKRLSSRLFLKVTHNLDPGKT